MRRYAILLGATVLLTAVFGGQANALLSLLGIKNSMVEFLLDQISVEGELEITAESVEEPEDGSTAIRGLTATDKDGVWLTVENLSFNWNPSRLLRGEVEFSSLEASGVKVLRQPNLPQEETPPPDLSKPQDLIPQIAWPRAPLTVRVDRMALTDVEIAEAVLGHAIRFDAVGAARDEGDVQSAQLELKRTDRIVGQIDFSYARNFEDNTLAFALQASEAAGGLVADLGGSPMDAASQVDLEGSGPPEDWRMAFDLGVADLIWADGNAAIAYAGPLKIDATFNARPGSKLSPEVAAVLGEEAELRAKVTEGENGLIVIEEGQVTSPHVRLLADGTYARSTGAVDMSLSMTAGAGLAQLFEGVAFDGAGFQGKVQGTPGNLGADGALSLDGLRTAVVDIGKAVMQTRYRQTELGGQVTHEIASNGQTSGLRIDRLQPDIFGEAETEFEASLAGDELLLEALWLRSDVLSTSFSGSANIATQDADLVFGLATSNLAPVARAYGVDVQGEIDIAGEVQRLDEVTRADVSVALIDLAHELADASRLALEGVVTQSGDRIEFDINGDGARVRLDRIQANLLPVVDLQATGVLQGTDMTLEALDLNAPLVKVSAKGALDTEAGDGQIKYALSTARLGPVSALYDQQVDGVLKADGVATLPKRDSNAAPRVTGDVNLQEFRFQGQSYGDLELGHDVLVSASPSGTLDLQVKRGRYAPARAQTKFDLQQPRLTLSGLNASALGATLRARDDVAINLDGPFVDGRFALSAKDLKRLSQITGATLGGALTGSLDLTSSAGRQNAAVNLTARNISSGGSKVGALALKGSARNILQTPVVDLNANANAVASGDIALRNVDASVKGPLSGLNLTAQTAGDFQDKPISLDMAARANAAGSTIRAAINALTAKLDKDQVTLIQPAKISVAGSNIAVRDLDVQLPDGGTLRGALTYFGGPVAADIALSAPRLGFLKRLAEVPIESGSLDIRANYDTRRGRGIGTAEIAGQGLVFENVDLKGGLNLSSTMDWKGSQADVQSSITGDFGDPLRLSASLPMRGGGPVPALSSRGPVSGKIDWQGQIGDLWALVPAPGHVLTGQTIIDLGVSGDIGDPQITGAVKVNDGGYQNLDLGTILTDLSIATTILGDGDLGLNISASDGAKGTVETTGRIGLGAPGIDLETKLKSAVLVRRDDVTARTAGAVSVKGPLNALNVTGGITIQDAEVRLINANPASVVTLDDVLIKGQPEPKQDDSTSNTNLNLTIDAPGRMFVRGRGLDSEWKMALAIRGNAASPRISGSIDRVRGQLDLIGKAFDLERGRIFFDGGRTIDPIIDVMLTRKTRDLTGRIVVDGPASDPELSFRSTPSLPEDEVLPRTLFGKSSQALTGSQAISLALGIATLMDGSGGTLDQVRGAAGLDSLRIDQDEDGNTSVAAGKEVADGVWVGTKQPLGEGGTSVVVEVEIIEDILLDTEIEAGGDASVGVQWKTDF